MSLPAGTILSSYEIVAPLGEGGMGAVYLARDIRLGRRVALKVLRHDVEPDSAARRRFGLEAQTASSLNHPNIISIFDIGHADQFDFIAMEHVEGRTLRALLAGHEIDVTRALDVAAQAAAGLAAAHDAQIVHRDIKPENLMVARAGHVKILDFGIAKLADAQRALLAAEVATATATPVMTRAGTIVGTMAYMSPEQAQGRPLDGRSDIFSLGTVLYELLTGRQPFAGTTTIDTLHAIIHAEPRPPQELNPGVPTEATEILAKALAKNPAERYRHAGDLELDLRRLLRGLKSGSLPSLRTAKADAPSGARAVMWIAVLVASLAVAALGLVWWRRPAGGLPIATGTLGRATLTPLTTDTGFEGEPTFSPDGETLAYVSDRPGNFDIFVRQVSGGADINVTNDDGDDVQPAFSPDGRQIAFVSTRSGAPPLTFMAYNSPPRGGAVWVMPALGGNARRVATDGNFPSWSPDGGELIYSSGPWFGQRLYRVSASGGEPQEIPLVFGVGTAPNHLLYPRFSPDGKWIAFSSTSDVFVVGAAGGEPAAIARGQGPVWAADSRSIVYSNGEVGTNWSLWSVPFDLARGQTAGDPQALTIGRGADLQATLSRDGKRIAFAATTVATRLEARDFDAETGRLGGAPVRLTDTRDVINFFDVSYDGRAALFELQRGPASTIWRAEANRPMVQLVSDGRYDHASPLWSPDRKAVAFSRRPTQDPKAPFSLWTMSADGDAPRRVVDRLGLNGLFTWMPDGRGIVHVGSDRQLYLLDLASNTERKLTNEPGVMPIVTISPDGAWVIYQCVVGATVDLHAVPAAGGETRVVMASGANDYHPSLSPSGRWVYYLPNHTDLYRIPGPAQKWRPAAPEKITNLELTTIAFIENPQLSRDGRVLAYTRGNITSDIWLITIP